MLFNVTLHLRFGASWFLNASSILSCYFSLLMSAGIVPVSGDNGMENLLSFKLSTSQCAPPPSFSHLIHLWLGREKQLDHWNVGDTSLLFPSLPPPPIACSSS